MASQIISIRIDEQLKREAEELFGELGLNLSTAITVFLKAALINDGFPFEVKRIPNAEMTAALNEYEDIVKNPDSYKKFDFADGMVLELMKND